jgi:hypothetical protein
MRPIFNNSCIGSLNITKSPHGSLLFEDFPMVLRVKGEHRVLGGLNVTNKIYITSHVLLYSFKCIDKNHKYSTY